MYIMFVIMISSCTRRYPRIVYMPDMYYSKSYEVYADAKVKQQNNKCKTIPFIKNEIRGGGESLYPVKHSIAQNKYKILPYKLTNSEKDYNKSKYIIKNPLKEDYDVTVKRGQAMYQIHCLICHGEKGYGDGFLVKNEKIFGVPDYANRNITIGSIYHVIVYGKNMMGSYAEQLNEEDRWRVSEYVLKLKHDKTHD